MPGEHCGKALDILGPTHALPGLGRSCWHCWFLPVPGMKLQSPGHSDCKACRSQWELQVLLLNGTKMNNTSQLMAHDQCLFYYLKQKRFNKTRSGAEPRFLPVVPAWTEQAVLGTAAMALASQQSALLPAAGLGQAGHSGPAAPMFEVGTQTYK